MQRIRAYDKRSSGKREVRYTENNVSQLFDLLGDIDKRLRAVENSLSSISSTGFVSGAGVANYHTVWSAVDSLRASNHVYDDNTNNRTGFGTTILDNRVCIDEPAGLCLKISAGVNNTTFWQAAGTCRITPSGEFVNVPDNKKYSAGNSSDISLYHSGGQNYIDTDNGQNLYVMRGAAGDFNLYHQAASGETRELKLWGFRAADALRSMEIGVGVDAADTASFDGVSNYFFDGNVGAGIVPAHRLHVYQNINGAMDAYVSNPNAGNAAYASIEEVSDTAFTLMRTYSSTHLGAYAGINYANMSLLYSQGSSSFVIAQQGNFPIYFTVNGNIRETITDTYIQSHVHFFVADDIPHGFGGAPGGADAYLKWDTTPATDSLLLYTPNFVISDTDNIGAAGYYDIYQDGCPTNFYFNLRHSATAHGITNYLPTDSFFTADINDHTYGGVNLIGASEYTYSTAMKIYGIAATYCGGSPYMRLIFGKKSGTGLTNISDSEIGLEVLDYNESLVKIYGNGDIWIKENIYTTDITGWTPTINSEGGGTAPVYSQNHCWYKKIGKTVFFSIFLDSCPVTQGAGANTLTITLPFTCKNQFYMLGNGRYEERVAGNYDGLGVELYSSTKLYFRKVSTGTPFQSQDQSDTGSKLVASGWYEEA